MSIALINLLIMLFMISSWAFVFLAVYFIPVIVAYVRKHNNTLAITIMTVFLGWTFFGWLAALLWALNSDIQGNDEED